MLPCRRLVLVLLGFVVVLAEQDVYDFFYVDFNVTTGLHFNGHATTTSCDSGEAVSFFVIWLNPFSTLTRRDTE